MIKRKLLIGWTMLLLVVLSMPVSAAVEGQPQKEGIFTYVIAENSVTITNVTDSQSKVVIPDQLGGFPVTAIAGGACGGCTLMQEVIVPDSVQEIGPMCFAYCTELTSVQLPANLKKISNGLFSQCTKLRNIKIPSSVKTIEKDAFYRCDSLFMVHLPESVKGIGETAFAACPNLAVATLPSGVTFIGSSAFEAADGFRIYAKPDTEAERYAKSAGITYEELITITINDEEVVFTQPPVTDQVNYRTLVPMRAVLEPLQAEISWDNQLNMAAIDLQDNRLLIRIGEPFMMVNGIARTLSSPAIEYNWHTLLPIRDVVEAIGGTVSWDEEKKHISITCSMAD